MAEQKITPWEVKVECKDNEMKTINYDHLITQFGCKKVEDSHVTTLNKILNSKPHHFFTRKLVFAHRDFDKILDSISKGDDFYIYTGRGPSSSSMHIGHSIPFVLSKYLQQTFKCKLIIQMTDDEKFLWSDHSLETIRGFMYSNIKDIIAFGLDPKLTYIFGNLKHKEPFNINVCKTSKLITLNEAIKVFGFTEESKVGQIAYPVKQIVPSFPTSFEFLNPNARCLIPCAIDQDPYFRLCREKAEKLNERKPASIYVSLLPDLRGPNRKMSASDSSSSIYLNDDMETIKKKITKYAFSGGKQTLAEQRKLGANTELDVAYQYLKFFYNDDEDLERIRKSYESGEMLTSEVKNKCIEVVQNFIKDYQEKRKLVTDEDVKNFMDDAKFIGDKICALNLDNKNE